MFKIYFFFRAKIPEFDGVEYLNVIFDKIHDSNFIGGVHIHSRYIYAFSQWSRGEIMKRLLKESFITEFCGMEIPRNHKLFDVLNLKIHQFFEAGITDYHVNYYNKFLDPNFFKKPKSFTKEYLHSTLGQQNPEGPQVLSMTHLEAGFVIWLVCVSLSLAAFFIEWLNVFKNFVVIWFTVMTLYKRKSLEITMRKTLEEASVKLEFLEEQEPEELEEQSEEICEYVSEDADGKFDTVGVVVKV